MSIGLVLYLADLRQVWSAIQNLNLLFITGTLFITLLWLSVRSKVWQTLLQEHVSYKQVFMTLNEGYLLNNILPFRMGEVGRAFLLGRKSGLGFWNVLSSIVIERALDLAMATGLLLAILPFVVGAAWAREGVFVVGGVVLFGFVVLYLLARNREVILFRFQVLVDRWPIFSKIGSNVIPAFLSGLGVLTDGSRFIKVVAWMSLNWLLTIVQFYFLLLAFFPSAMVIWAAFSVSVVSLGIAVPSMPGAVGVWELSIVAALSIFDLDLSAALAYALTIHFSNYLVTGVLGAYALVKDGESLLGLFNRLRLGKEIS
ncbi:MAG: flippase-like domain-containing protein [Anaerolineales bacterium]|nr:flippase-like domain-containing protein [Anaerolineales bacterium]